MKKLIIIGFSAIFAFASCNREAASNDEKKVPESRIVYVNTDTLLTNYDYYKEIQKEFEQKGFKLENEMKRKANSFQHEVELFQKKIQSGTMTQQQAENTQIQLQKKEQEIMNYRDNAGAALAKEQAEKTDALLTKIQEYLKNYNSDNKYDMVIGYSKGGGVLYAKEDLDITEKVLKGLNDEYNGKSKKEEVKADSTTKK